MGGAFGAPKMSAGGILTVLEETCSDHEGGMPCAARCCWACSGRARAFVEADQRCC